MNYENEIPKHKKKKNNPSPQKSKHRHNYVDVIGKINRKNNTFSYLPYQQCSECGKLIPKMLWFEVDSDKPNCKKVLFDIVEIQKHYPNLNIIDID